MGFYFFQFFTWTIAFWFSMFVHDLVLYGYARFGEVQGKNYDPVLYEIDPPTMASREWIGLLLMPFLCFQWAFFIAGFGFMLGLSRSPLFFDWIDEHPRRAAIVHCFGPLVHLLLLAASFWALSSGLHAGEFAFRSSDFTFHLVDGGFLDPLVEVLVHIYVYNLVLFILQMLPLPGFDGAYICLLFLPKRWAQWVNLRMHQWRYFGMTTAWLLFLIFGGNLLNFAWKLVL